MSKNPISVRGLTPREVLGLHPSASEDEVRGAFRLLAKVFHPDLLDRGAALFQLVQAAHDAALVGNVWPGALDALAGFERGFPPGVPASPAAPRAARPGVARASWRMNKKGGWSRKESGEYVNVFFRGLDWHWAGPDLLGGTNFCDGRFVSAQDAMVDADAYYGADAR